MRPYPQLQLVAFLVATLAGCGGGSHAADDATATPAPLTSCETRTLTIDGDPVVVFASVDAKPVKIAISESDPSKRDRIYQQMVQVFGTPSPDPRTMQRPYKWGLIQVTDLCGRLASPSPSPH